MIVFLAWSAIHNAAENLARAKIASGFGFWDNTAGFDISQTLIDYSTTSTYGRAFWVGLLNTLLVAALGIVLATILGFLIGIARLSKNWLVARLAGFYVEIIRNIPLLLQLLFWYNAVLKALPACATAWRSRAAASSTIAACSCRSRCSLPALALALDRARRRHRRRDRAAAIWARRRQMRTGQQAPVLWVALGARRRRCRSRVLALSGFPVTFDYPRSRALQHPRRHRNAAGIRGAAVRARDLHRGLHRRSGARRHPGGVARARPRRPIRSACAPGRRCGSS